MSNIHKNLANSTFNESFSVNLMRLGGLFDFMKESHDVWKRGEDAWLQGVEGVKLVVDTFSFHTLVKHATTGPVVHLVMLQYEILNEENISSFDFTPLDD